MTPAVSSQSEKPAAARGRDDEKTPAPPPSAPAPTLGVPGPAGSCLPELPGPVRRLNVFAARCSWSSAPIGGVAVPSASRRACRRLGAQTPSPRPVGAGASPSSSRRVGEPRSSPRPARVGFWARGCGSREAVRVHGGVVAERARSSCRRCSWTRGRARPRGRARGRRASRGRRRDGRPAVRPRGVGEGAEEGGSGGRGRSKGRARARANPGAARGRPPPVVERPTRGGPGGRAARAPDAGETIATRVARTSSQATLRVSLRRIFASERANRARAPRRGN